MESADDVKVRVRAALKCLHECGCENKFEHYDQCDGCRRALRDARSALGIYQDAVLAEVPELLTLVERLSENGPWKFANECAGCGLDIRFFRKGTPHSHDCPFLLLEQWKAES